VTAATKEERFSRRKNGKAPAPFSTWEVPKKAAAAWCRRHSKLSPADFDAVVYSYDTDRAPPPTHDITTDE